MNNRSLAEIKTELKRLLVEYMSLDDMTPEKIGDDMKKAKRREEIVTGNEIIGRPDSGKELQNTMEGIYPTNPLSKSIPLSISIRPSLSIPHWLLIPIQFISLSLSFHYIIDSIIDHVIHFIHDRFHY